MDEFLPKKVALVLPSLKFGGAERVALNLAKALKEKGIQVDILLMSKEGEFLSEAERDFTVVDLQCNRTFKLPGKLYRYLTQQHPDVLLSSFWKLNLCACLSKFLYKKVILLLWEHSPPSKSKQSPKWLYAFSASIFYRMATKIVVVSTGVYNDVEKWTVGLNKKLVVIFNPISPPVQPLFTQYKRTGEKQIVWVGRLDDPKNPCLMLEAFALIPTDCNANLVFIGDGRQRKELEVRCQCLGLVDKVRFAGYQMKPYELMVESDLLVLSSDREGLPSVIIEAMYCGLRIIATDCGQGIHDILLDNHYGTIVPTNDKVAMAKAIESELCMSHSSEEQLNGAQRFLPNVIVQQFLAAMH